MTRKHSTPAKPLTAPAPAAAKPAPAPAAAKPAQAPAQVVRERVADQRPSQDEIRLRAYLAWEAAGRPLCDGVQFWLEAERQLSTRQLL